MGEGTQEEKESLWDQVPRWDLEVGSGRWHGVGTSHMQVSCPCPALRLWFFFFPDLFFQSSCPLTLSLKIKQRPEVRGLREEATTHPAAAAAAAAAQAPSRGPCQAANRWEGRLKAEPQRDRCLLPSSGLSPAWEPKRQAALVLRRGHSHGEEPCSGNDILPH